MSAKSLPARTPAATGLLLGLSAYMLWGLFPLFWPLLEPANPIEILACRIVFCFVVVAILLAARHQVRGVRRMDRGTVLRLCAAGVAIAINWGVYIWGVNNGHVIETSLGYFINPLFTILLGVFVLHERLRPGQWVAVGIASSAIVVLTIDYGRLPWIAFVLATSFGLYGLLKKRADVGAVESLAIETAVMALPALITLSVIAGSGSLAFGRHGPQTSPCWWAPASSPRYRFSSSAPR